LGKTKGKGSKVIAKLGERGIKGKEGGEKPNCWNCNKTLKYVKKNPKKKKKNGREDCAKTIVELCKRKKTNTKGNVSL
jgi:hypothetical protein